MAALTFSQSGNGYIATAQVNADFAIHVECASKSTFSVEATILNGGEPEIIYSEIANHFEKAWSSKVYPMYITVFSSVNPIANKSIIQEAE